MWHLIDGKAIKDGRKVSFHNSPISGFTFTNSQIQRLFPPPKSHATQKLKFTLYDILRNEFTNLAGKGWKSGEERSGKWKRGKGKRGKGKRSKGESDEEKNNDGVSLPLDPLRGWIEEGAWCGLVHEGVLEDDNLSEYGSKVKLADGKDSGDAHNRVDENASEGNKDLEDENHSGEDNEEEADSDEEQQQEEQDDEEQDDDDLKEEGEEEEEDGEGEGEDEDEEEEEDQDEEEEDDEEEDGNYSA